MTPDDKRRAVEAHDLVEIVPYLYRTPPGEVIDSGGAGLVYRDAADHVTVLAPSGRVWVIDLEQPFPMTVIRPEVAAE